ncbi:MAG: DNA mismatch endonuclease Vsr [Actinobacteria bacterium]|nr:DNA mismatch endonuclease Vsr [Actinomycetota bacterium]
MSRMPRSATGPEMALRKAFHSAGLRFTVNRSDLPGKPDIVLSKARIAIFVDGCFWHGCAEHGTLPRNNREWWAKKLEGNRERDERKDAELADIGWVALHFWEHEDVSQAARIVRGLWMQRTGRAG